MGFRADRPVDLWIWTYPLMTLKSQSRIPLLLRVESFSYSSKRIFFFKSANTLSLTSSLSNKLDYRTLPVRRSHIPAPPVGRESLWWGPRSFPKHGIVSQSRFLMPSRIVFQNIHGVNAHWGIRRQKKWHWAPLFHWDKGHLLLEYEKRKKAANWNLL